MIDVLIVAYLIYLIYKLLRGTIAFNIFIGLVLFYVTWWLVRSLDMKLLTLLLDEFVTVGVIIVVIIFQPEIRQFLLMIGNNTQINRMKFFHRFFGENSIKDVSTRKIVKSVSEAVSEMSKNKLGALIVLSDSPSFKDVCTSGVELNADISAQLIQSIFSKESILHDGAMILLNDKILAAGSILPVSNSATISADLGLRHRAGIGVTENRDVISVIVSEETGEISYAKEGILRRDISIDKLEKMIIQRLKHYN